MGLDQAIEAEAQAQAICMQTQDFERAYQAFVGEGEAGLRGRLMPDRASSTGRSSSPAIARSAERLDAWAAENLGRIDHADIDAACRELVAKLGEAGWLTHSAVDPTDPGASSTCARSA